MMLLSEWGPLHRGGREAASLEAPVYVGASALSGYGAHMSQKPSVGRIVHYTSYGTPGGEYPSVCRAAIVTAVTEFGRAESTLLPELQNSAPYWLDLCVLNPEGMFFNRTVAPCLKEGGQGGTWHWPERVD